MQRERENEVLSTAVRLKIAFKKDLGSPIIFLS